MKQYHDTVTAVYHLECETPDGTRIKWGATFRLIDSVKKAMWQSDLSMGTNQHKDLLIGGRESGRRQWAWLWDLACDDQYWSCACGSHLALCLYSQTQSKDQQLYSRTAAVSQLWVALQGVSLCLSDTHTQMLILHSGFRLFPDLRVVRGTMILRKCFTHTLLFIMQTNHSLILRKHRMWSARHFKHYFEGTVWPKGKEQLRKWSTRSS